MGYSNDLFVAHTHVASLNAMLYIVIQCWKISVIDIVCVYRSACELPVFALEHRDCESAGGGLRAANLG